MSNSDLVVNAFLARKRYSCYERKVKIDSKGRTILLIFDYPMAVLTKDGRMFFKELSIGVTSIVTSQFYVLLNALSSEKNGAWRVYSRWQRTLYGNKWNGDWVEVFSNDSPVNILNYQNPFEI